LVGIAGFDSLGLQQHRGIRKLKEKRQRHKDNAKFGDVAKEWGRAADLDVKVDAQLASIQRDYWDMRNESFMAWGARIAKELGATFKIIGRKAILVPRNGGTSASGQTLTAVQAFYGRNIINWRLSARPEPRALS
jgi:phage protein D